jgi:MFS family permease
MMTTLVGGPFYLGLGLSEVLSGLVMSIGPLISIFTGFPSGRAVDAWGARSVLGIGLIILTLGALMLFILSHSQCRLSDFILVQEEPDQCA